MLLHASTKWKTHITANLWPYAIRMANEVLNSTPCPQLETRQTPQQVFDRTKVLPNPKHFQPFGCPTYVLATPLQAGNAYHKWKERSRVGIYIGPSPLHGRNVALVLDPSTGLVSPQHNVRFDSNFDTVKSLVSASLWQEKAGFLSKRENETPAPTPTGEPIRKRRKQVQIGDMPPSKRGKSASEGDGRETEDGKRAITNGTNQMHSRKDEERGESPLGSENIPSQTLNDSPGLSPNVIEDELQLPEVQEPARPLGSASGANNESIQPRLVQAMSVEIFKDPHDDMSMQGEIFCLETMHPDWDAYDEPGGPLAMKASADPDTMYHHEAMREPDRDEFKKAMQKEIDDQMENGNFEIIKRREVPKGATILPAIWQMKRKRDILSRQVKKWKARLNVDGSRMRKGIHYDQTYAPVASWNSIRTLLALTAIHNWHTVQLDYVLAFPQAPVEKEIYMEIPRGVKLSDRDETKDYVLKLKRNVYGQKQAGQVWNK
jgi:Reverse transcriptase (RNA-dependent DNA polymerase).